MKTELVKIEERLVNVESTFEKRFEELAVRVTHVESVTQETRRVIDRLTKVTREHMTAVEQTIDRLIDRLEQVEDLHDDEGVTMEQVQKFLVEVMGTLKAELITKFDTQLTAKVDVTTQQLLKVVQDTVAKENEERDVSDAKLRELIEQLRKEFEERSTEVISLRSQLSSLTTRVTSITERMTTITGQEGSKELRAQFLEMMRRLEERIRILEQALLIIRTRLTKVESMRISSSSQSSSTHCRCLKKIRTVNGVRTESKSCTRDGVPVSSCDGLSDLGSSSVGSALDSDSSTADSSSAGSDSSSGFDLDSLRSRIASSGSVSSSSSSSSSQSSSSSVCRCFMKVHYVNGQRSAEEECLRDGVKVASCADNVAAESASSDSSDNSLDGLGFDNSDNSLDGLDFHIGDRSSWGTSLASGSSTAHSRQTTSSNSTSNSTSSNSTAKNEQTPSEQEPAVDPATKSAE